MAAARLDQRVAAVRRFNRFYTQKIGVLQEGLLASPFSLAEARVLYELAHRDGLSQSDLARELGLDAGYLSRILGRFESNRLLTCARSLTDKRKSHLALTQKGRRAFAPLNARSQEEIGSWLAALPEAEQQRLVDSMQSVERILGTAPETKPLFLLRSHQPGDMGWVIARHGALYAEEYGWDETFEALVAEIAAKFLRRFDPKRERCWIAEKDGAIVGSVILVRRSTATAQLRLLIVDPRARGLGIGERLVEECIGFARRAGYRKIMLWTNSILHAARRIYERKGFHLVKEERYRGFGHDLVGQFWELKL